MNHIGTKQGRLVSPEDNRINFFPRQRWENEFRLAAQAGLECIEWIYDLYGADVNPLATDAGVQSMRSLSKKHMVRILSVCADYFMDKPLIRVNAKELEERLQCLFWVLRQGQHVGVQYIVLPFLDASRIDTEAEFNSVVELLKRVVPVASETGVNIHLETSLEPARFGRLLSKVPDPAIKVNYDTGNSASLGYSPREEFAYYGKRVGSIHIKDRVRGGGTVPLGTGAADFESVASCLIQNNYAGDFILEVARGLPGDEVNWNRQNCEFVKKNFVLKG